MSKRKTVLAIALLWLNVLAPYLLHAQQKADNSSVTLSWLDSRPSTLTTGTTWGMPWPQGKVRPNQNFELSSDNNKLSLQSWPLAYWPDGSIKWSAHACTGLSANDTVLAIRPTKTQLSGQQSAIKVTDNDKQITISNNEIAYTLEKTGTTIISSIKKHGRIVAQNAQLVVNIQNAPDNDGSDSLFLSHFNGTIDSTTIEQSGPVRAVVRVNGKHASAEGKKLLPFVLRFYFYAGDQAMKMSHTFIYDADENNQFINGIGITFDMPMDDAPYNRFVRFVGDNGGVFSEAVQGLTGLRRDAGASAKQAQIDGKQASDINSYVADRLNYVPSYGDYTLHQPSPDGFTIAKRTKKGYGWISAAKGTRASGTVYLGSSGGGLALGLRNFWQKYPTQIDIRDAASPLAKITMWLWAPNSPAMDLRFYHDGMGQDTYEKQWDGLEMTYEDYEKGYGSPMGVALTSELTCCFTDSTPSAETLVDFANNTNTPPLLTCNNQYLQSCQVFGKIWDVKDTVSAFRASIEKKLDSYFDYYQQQIVQHKWYGFWDYGDVMHTYDANKHMWRYDVGGFAWDNSELSTDIWLWYYYLHSARPQAFRMAEAMSRHTGEVDVHHIGPYAPLGSRHNVMHWGCSAKQMRISTAANRRFLYYLTADERIGDLLSEQVNAYKTLQQVQPMRKRKEGEHPLDSDPNYINMSFGTDWGAVAAAWFTQWERTGDKAIKQKLMNSMATIAAQPKGFFTGSGHMEITTGKFVKSQSTQASASHLNAVFGLFEICAELNESLPNKAFKDAWLQYCTLYNATPDEQKRVLGNELGKNALQQSHSRLTAYAAKTLNNKQLAKRAWNEFLDDTTMQLQKFPKVETVLPPKVLNPVVEAKGISTNATAQWGLSAIQCLFLLRDTDK
jgi:hypothetical protein